MVEARFEDPSISPPGVLEHFYASYSPDVCGSLARLGPNVENPRC